MFSQITDGSVSQNPNLGRQFSHEPPIDVQNIQNIQNIQNMGTFDTHHGIVIRNIQAQADPFGQNGQNWQQ